MSYSSSTSTSSAIDYTSTSTIIDKTGTATANATIGITEATSLRKSLGKTPDYFDERLLGKKLNIQFQFNPAEYDIVYANIVSTGASETTAKILAYEVLALSKFYNEPYDKILPLVSANSLNITKLKVDRLNFTRPNTNQLSIINSDINLEINKEQVD